MRTYVLTFAGLLILTTLTLLLSFAPLGDGAMPTAMAIASVKTVLVALFFMHLVEHRTTSWVAVLVSLLLAGTLIGLSALDVTSRFVALAGPPG